MKKILMTLPLWFLACLFLVSCGKDEGENAPAVESAPAITDLMAIAGSNDRRSLVGRKVEASGASVQGVVGNYFFWAGDLRQQIPVARLDKQRGAATERVEAGFRVKITGTVRLVESLPETDPLWDEINARERTDIKAAIVYIAADPVEIQTR